MAEYLVPDIPRIGLAIGAVRQRIVMSQSSGRKPGARTMKRNDIDRKVVDLGKASRETKGGHVGAPEGIGQLPTFGLSRD
jgi:hypothetical protein